MKSPSIQTAARQLPLGGNTRRVWPLAGILLLFVGLSAGQGQGPAGSSRAGHPLHFSFSGHSWRSVLEWLADEADCALHVGEVPTGSFTYSDSRGYTPDQAISRINQFLIPKGFTLVRSGNLLSVISVEDTRSLKQLDALAELVPIEKLKELGDFEVVKCLFPLGKADTEDGVRELSAVTLMTEPVQLPTTNQLLITDTAAKLRIVQKILAALSSPDATLDRVKSLPLDGLDAEAALAVIRPHVGLEGDILIGGDIRLSTDAAGKTLYVSGTKEQVDTVVSLVEALKAPPESQAEGEERTLQSHPVKGADLQTVFNVLQTLLSGEDARLSQEATTNSIVALGTQQVHSQIVDTIATLNGSNVAFKVIDLHSIDPYYAVSLLKGMFAPAADGDPAAASADPMRIDADPINMRLFVRAKPAQIEEMEKVIRQLAAPDEGRTSMRLLPYFGTRGRQVLETARAFWPGEHTVLILPDGSSSEVSERAAHPREKENPGRPVLERPQSSPGRLSPERGEPASHRMTSRLVRHDGAPAAAGARPTSGRAQVLIRGTLTPRGILIQSDDLDALDRFEEHVRMIAGPEQGEAAQTVVYYLKYASAEEAARFFRELLGRTPAEPDSSGTLVSSTLPSAGKRALDVTRASANSAATVNAGTTTILTDARLNRLIVMGTASDIALVEKYLPIIDKDSSLTDPETHGAPRVVQLMHTPAESVAAIVRDAYSGRIASTAQEKQAARQAQMQRNAQSQRQQGPQNQPSQRRTSAPAVSAVEPKFTLAVDNQSNSLIVTAPKQLADEVEQLATQLDRKGAQTIRVMALDGSTGTPYVRQALESVLGKQMRSRPATRP